MKTIDEKIKELSGKVEKLPPVYINGQDLFFIRKEGYFDFIKKLVDKRGLDDKVWAFIANNDDKIQAIGIAVIAYGNRYDDYKKYIVQAFGYGIKYAGKYLDSKIVTIKELEESRKGK